MSYPNTQLYIDGIWREATGGRVIPVLNPATGREIGTVAHAAREDLDAALAAAERGFQIWKAVPAYERAKLMRAAAALLRERADTIAPILVMENGKPLAQAKMEIAGAADVIEWFAGEAPRTYGQVIPSRATDVLQFTVKGPVGPVAAFTPWNFPINQVVRKLCAALAAGCSIIVKAPEETPASPAALIAVFADAGLPAGVMNLVYGIPAEISEYLIPHPVIRKISFTGSTPVGKQLAALAGLHMKRATMELGGHAPVIVAGDADLDLAVPQIGMHKFRNAGQVCVSPTRFLVQESLHEDFAARFTAIAKKVKVGDGLDPETEMGPLSNARRVPALEALVQDAVDQGARLTTGGRRLGNEGYFFEPTVLVDVPLSARIMHEEPFGPIAVINRFTTLDEAIAEANRLPFGLAAYAYTSDTATATRLGHEIEAGMLTINHLGIALPEVPFGGMKDSGHGTEGGSEAIEAYLETRFVTRKG
ncbi:NAD-dependent succinate-semialdehyde dehydrogenase [Xinfangfangia sp. CPCC 101601]|uniref:NAD-dependent succinate-semialdehyde dehydrogenase n=1 Tax=Pseudogemmobacter lacusdianii TaxID=3069608 RepID=A0ABU0W2H8_9RHOB|nr:NAD-dependent succinate-semialdehyde dehydrogenase [Xinfangfangia sp. CPCC 101601]MDQ2068209.1 NAD-dependent succinate-semialdehyde dehydrogenase [Xinfangfangia sp. CPCC 101601]